MIQINDNDLPITAAEKIISGVKQYNPTLFEKSLAVAFVGNDEAGNTVDMFNLEEIKEIADYLMVYYNTHINGD